jgi:hypothetical protein
VRNFLQSVCGGGLHKIRLTIVNVETVARTTKVTPTACVSLRGGMSIGFSKTWMMRLSRTCKSESRFLYTVSSADTTI